jgi:hypothetical protein
LETSKLKLLQQKLQVQPVIKVAAGSKIRKCQCCKTEIYTLFWCLISEDRLHRSLATAKINSTKVNNVRARMSKSEGEHDKTKQIITKKKRDFKSS